MAQPWPAALALMLLALLLAAWALWRGRWRWAALCGAGLALASLLLTLRQMSPGVALRPPELVFLLGNALALVLALWLATRPPQAARPGLQRALWLWNTACLGLLAWLAWGFRLFG
jgi:hypothetical protein